MIISSYSAEIHSIEVLFLIYSSIDINQMLDYLAISVWCRPITPQNRQIVGQL